MHAETIVPQIASTLGANLTDEELRELDDVVTPRVAELFVKAFGDQMWDILAPLTENDTTEEEPLGPEAEQVTAEAQLRDMMRDPRYCRDRDPGHVAKVATGFGRLFPGDGS